MFHNIKHSYPLYKGNTVFGNRVSIIGYCEILFKFMAFLSKLMLEGFTLEMPGRLGDMYIYGKKKKIFVNEAGDITNLTVDWQKTNKLWDDNPKAKEEKQLVYFLNEHSNSIYYNAYWEHSDSMILNKSYYSFTFSRANNRALAKSIKDGMEYQVSQFQF